MTKLLEAAKAALKALDEAVLQSQASGIAIVTNNLYAAIAEEEADRPLTDEFFHESEWIVSRHHTFRHRRCSLIAKCYGTSGRWIWAFGDELLPAHPQTTKPARDLLRALKRES